MSRLPVGGLGRLFAAQLAAWTLLVLASPGVALRDGSPVLAALGVALWGASAALVAPSDDGRPQPRRWRAFLAEAVPGALGGTLILAWIGYVVAPGLVWVALGTGVYAWLGCALVRRLHRRLPLALAVALGWLGAESLRIHVPAPFGLSWMQLGHHLHASAAVAGSARLWGVEGLSLVLALAAGGLAQLLARRRPLLAAAALLAPLGLALSVARLLPPPATVPGPRLLLVQPGFPQERKLWSDPREQYRDLRALTLEAELDARRAGEPPFDLVCWGETMLPLPLFEPEVEEALRSGRVEPAPWSRLGAALAAGKSPAELVEEARRAEDDVVRLLLLGVGGLPSDGRFLAPGTSFLTGAEVYAVRGGRLVRWNAVVLYDPAGRRSPPAAKRFLVPGAESGMGLERFGPARAFARWIGGYVPDFAGGEATGVLELGTRDGRRFRLGATVCFDNAFLAPYVEPLREGELDLHLVVSNEAWYRESWEMDQMIAFSRLIALSTGRSVARATNSGVSLVLGPDGREVARLVVGGRDRSVAGTLAASVPVPAPGSAARTPYVATRPLWVLLVLVLPWLLLLLPARRDPLRSEP